MVRASMTDGTNGMRGEPTTWSPGLIGFYLSCTVVAIGAAVAAIVTVVFPDSDAMPTLAVIGGVMVVGGSIAALRTLKAARSET